MAAESGLKFLFDADVSWRLAAILSVLDDAQDLRCVGRKPCSLPANASDEKVHAWAARYGRIVISKDDSQLDHLPTVDVIRRMGGRVIYVTKGMPVRDPRLQGIWILQQWPDLLEAAGKLGPGQVAKYRVDGTIRYLTPKHPGLIR